MQGLNNYIIELESPYNEKFKTESGIELFGNVDFTPERLSNRVAIIKGIPALCKGEIKEGYEVLIDFTVFYRQIYHGVKQWYNSVIDADKNLYHITPNMIVCYRESKRHEWKGFDKNLLVEPILEGDEIESTLILPDTVSSAKEFKGKVKVLFVNSQLKKLGIQNKDVVLMNPNGGVQFWIEGKEYWWIRTKDVYGQIA
ncbi:Co-chaperonin GroES (HSP10) [Tenacibaculum sp. MAR_2009_124]|uniref:hypothetical protein n=1 Tax=Tenacibaculum sp. MAR_2009_124 TaxID=1250059 RepID=UPI0008990461|nr:hypothetical protein [Tenacibaculum sp. MAR_2009_124]SED10680.1 Co-chaperonin GroES (HSP10) [Tenacibaculum sp. MAR_2009_124]